MAITAKDYYEGILKTAGAALSPEKQQAFMTMISDPDFEKVLATDVIAPRLRQDDYSRNMDALKAKEKTWTEWYSGALAKTASDQQIVDAARSKVAEYEAQYGTLTVEQRAAAVTQTVDSISKKDFDTRLQQQEQGFITLLKWAATKPLEHLQRFGTTLDVAAVEKLAVEKGINLNQAYEELVAPIAATKTAAEFDAKLKAAREEGAREFASTHQIPMDTAPKTQHHVLFDRKPESELPPAGPGREKASLQGFVEAWNSVPVGTSSE